LGYLLVKKRSLKKKKKGNQRRKRLGIGKEDAYRKEETVSS